MLNGVLLEIWTWLDKHDHHATKIWQIIKQIFNVDLIEEKAKINNFLQRIWALNKNPTVFEEKKHTTP